MLRTPERRGNRGSSPIGRTRAGDAAEREAGNAFVSITTWGKPSPDTMWLVWALDRKLLPGHVLLVTSSLVGRQDMTDALTAAGYQEQRRLKFFPAAACRLNVGAFGRSDDG